jgi:hypothetical protein
MWHQSTPQHQDFLRYFQVDNNQEQIEAELQALLADRKEAQYFVTAYQAYTHLVDDCVDEEKSEDRVRQLTQLAGICYNCEYWKKYGHLLYIVDRLIHNTYFDAAEWEKSDDKWKRQHAASLVHCNYNMLFAVVMIEFGECKLKEISLKVREAAHRSNLSKEPKEEE